MADIFDRPGGRFRMALYKLDEVGLEAIVTENAARIDLILSNTGKGDDGQSNNGIRIDDDTIAAAYLEYWQRLHADEQLLPEPLGASMQANHQGEALRRADTKSGTTTFEGGSTAEVWFAPNMTARKYGKDPETPPDLEKGWDGFLDRTDTWQDHASTLLSRYFAR
jgi:hypothetical protein